MGVRAGCVAGVLVMVAACAEGTSHEVDGGIDAAVAHDAAREAATADAPTDRGSDAAGDGSVDLSLGTDLGADAASDATIDARSDTGTDVGVDAGADAGHDAAIADLGVDAGAMLITWTTNATTHTCPADVGTRFVYTCPSGGTPSSLWGTGEYTNDSSICAAAVHAGRITLAAGGTVTIEMRAGRTSYTGSARNGITSSSYGTWGCSYAVVLPACSPPLASCSADTCTDLSTDSANCGMCGMPCLAPLVCAASACGCMPGRTLCGASCVDTTSDRANCGMCGMVCPAAEVCAGSACTGSPATWSTNATTHSCPADVGMQFTYACPAGGTPGSVWGTDTYTHDSSICTAAVHVGRITLASGGPVTIQMAPGASSYTGSTRNGITTLSYPAWTCSYTIP